MSAVPPTNRLSSIGTRGEPAPVAAGVYKWELVALLWFAFFLNQGDRQIYNVVLPLIGPDLNLDAVQLGLVVNCAFDPSGRLGLVVTEAGQGKLWSLPHLGPGVPLSHP